jgi:uncharacterized damage-inducible protein DinB
MVTRIPAPSEPAESLSDPAELLSAYLDWYREALLRKLEGLSDAQLRTSVVPSGWVPLALVKHLTHVERRWLQWGFAGVELDDPWGASEDIEWRPQPDESTAAILAAYRAECDRSRAITAGIALDQPAADGGAYAPGDDRPTLAWVQVHLLQEYARHVGHLDIARELIDGTVGG